MVVVDPAGRPCFFVEAVMGQASWSCFFIGIAMDLAIGETILTEREITVGFFGLFL